MSHAAHLTSPICSILLAAQAFRLPWLRLWALVVSAQDWMGLFKSTILNACSSQALKQLGSNSMACCPTWELTVASFLLCWETSHLRRCPWHFLPLFSIILSPTLNWKPNASFVGPWNPFWIVHVFVVWKLQEGRQKITSDLLTVMSLRTSQSAQHTDNS